MTLESYNVIPFDNEQPLSSIPDEFPVMGNKEQCTRIIAQHTSKPRENIQVVGRFVRMMKLGPAETRSLAIEISPSHRR